MHVLRLAEAAIIGSFWGFGSFAVTRYRKRLAQRQIEQRTHDAVMDRLTLEQLAGLGALDNLPSASLKITRTKRIVREPDEWHVMIDGEAVGTLSTDESSTFSLTSGPHEVHLSAGDRLWSPSVNVKLEPGQTTSLMCRRHFPIWLLTWAMLHPDRWIELIPAS